jgi:hypothetical protein
MFDMCISGLILGEILLSVQMLLKQAAGPAVAIKERYLRAFQDAALLQTSLLDGWDTSTEYSIENREEFRQFLVDAHKAAYVCTIARMIWMTHLIDCFLAGSRVLGRNGY